jgi:hypothetical protein
VPISSSYPLQNFNRSKATHANVSRIVHQKTQRIVTGGEFIFTGMFITGDAFTLCPLNYLAKNR